MTCYLANLVANNTNNIEIVTLKIGGTYWYSSQFILIPVITFSLRYKGKETKLPSYIDKHLSAIPWPAYVFAICAFKYDYSDYDGEFLLFINEYSTCCIIQIKQKYSIIKMLLCSSVIITHFRERYLPTIYCHIISWDWIGA